MKSITDFNVKDKRVLVRCDFNVPLNDDGSISDDFRIQKTLPTIQYLMKKKAKIILATHLGEPEGQVVPSLALDKVKERLESLLSVSIKKTNDCIGVEVEKHVADVKAGEILLLENLRFHKEETDNDAAFAKALAKHGEIYINEAFSDCHRAHASMVGVPTFLPHGMGLLLESEIKNLNKILIKPKKPLVVLVGGIKVGTKAAFIEHILSVADTVLVSGLIKKEMQEKEFPFATSEKILGPTENLDAKDIDAGALSLFTEKILAAKTIVWNGPFGKFEDKEYRHGTLEIANTIAGSKAFSVVGGGETIEFLHQEGMLDKFSHISTGGGAMLAYLSGEKLPGLEALDG